MMADAFFPKFSLMSVNGVLTWIRWRIFIKVCVTVDQIELKEMDPAARVHDVWARWEHFTRFGGSLDPLGTTLTRTKANV